MPALLLIFLFIVVPIAELAVIIQVGQAIGLAATIAILVADSVLGAALLRSQGVAAWRRLNETIRAGRSPHREVLDGALVVFGGALLLTPGFITDVLGLLLLIPAPRAVARRVLTGLISRRLLFGLTAVRAVRGRQSGRGARPGRDYDVEGTATDVDGSAQEPSERRIGR